MGMNVIMGMTLHNGSMTNLGIGVIAPLHHYSGSP
jgi:hypothetical protein